MIDPVPAKKPKSGWLNIVVDYGPILIFFLVYRYYSPDKGHDPVGELVAVVKSTAAFMVSAVIALLVSRFKLGHVSPMLMLSTALIVGFGGLTILLRDPWFIQVKPTAIYLMFGAVLLFGWWRGKSYLKVLLEAAFEGLSDEGWLKLSRNWAWFFVFLAGLNELVRHQLSFDAWLQAKLWLFMPLSFLFTFTQLPMLLRHGLQVEAKDEVTTDPPHE